MQFRRYQNSDLSALYEMHQQAGYGFDLPDVEKMEGSFVAVEDGKIVGWAGWHLVPEAIMLMDQKWGSPHWKLGVIRALHIPIQQEMISRGYKKAFCNLDSKFPRFWKALKRLGWEREWETMWRDVKDQI